jgi:hypothetical protein
MISILVGLAAIASWFFIFYITGKTFSSHFVAYDDESDYLGQGLAIWMVIGSIGLVCFLAGKLILHFI